MTILSWQWYATLGVVWMACWIMIMPAAAVLTNNHTDWMKFTGRAMNFFGMLGLLGFLVFILDMIW